MSDERKLTEDERIKIQRLLESGTLENINLALSLIEETADSDDISRLFTKDVILELICLGNPLRQAGGIMLKCSRTWHLFVDTLTDPLVMTGRDLSICKSVEGGYLSFSAGQNVGNMTAFSLGALAELADSGHDVNLTGLTNLSDAAAESLGKHKGDLSLDGLASLSDAAAESLSKHKGDLSLDGLASLSDAAAESLSKHKGYLNLDGLAELSDAAAESLSNHKGNLSLDGLASLSDAAAESLSKHKGNLSLDGLASLSDAAAESLSKHKGYLNVSGLTKLSDAAAESLSRMFKDHLAVNDALAELLQNARKKTDTEAVLTKTQKSKFAKMLKTKNPDNVQMVCVLLNNVDASDEEWLSVFTPFKLKVLLNSWDTDIWNSLAVAMRNRVQLFEALADVATGRFDTYWDDCHPKHENFLVQTIESGVVETFDLLDFSFRRRGFEKEVKGKMLGS